MSSNRNPLIAILRGGFAPAWSLADQAEKDQVTEHWVNIHANWPGLGARLLATLDDVHLRVGLPGGTRPWSFYEVWEVPDHETVKAMLDDFRPQDGVSIRLDKYMRVEAVVGVSIKEIHKAVEQG